MSVVFVSGVEVSESVLHTYIHSFLDSFPIYIITVYWVEFSVLYSRPLLVNCFIYNSYVNPNFPTYSSPVLPPDNHTFVFYVSNSIYVSLISSFIAFFFNF